MSPFWSRSSHPDKTAPLRRIVERRAGNCLFQARLLRGAGARRFRNRVIYWSPDTRMRRQTFEGGSKRGGGAGTATSKLPAVFCAARRTHDSAAPVCVLYSMVQPPNPEPFLPGAFLVLHLAPNLRDVPGQKIADGWIRTSAPSGYNPYGSTSELHRHISDGGAAYPTSLTRFRGDRCPFYPRRWVAGHASFCNTITGTGLSSLARRVHISVHSARCPCEHLSTVGRRGGSRFRPQRRCYSSMPSSFARSTKK